MSAPRNRWIELGLRAYPRAFRERFGDEIRADARGSEGPRACLRLFASGLAERWAALARLLSWSADRPHLYRPAGRHALLWEHVWMDARHATRAFLRAPAFTALAVGVLALGIAINIAVFTVLHAVLLRPLPFADPDRLVMIWSVDADRHHDPVAPGDYEDFVRAESFAGLGYALSFLNAMLVEGDEGAGPVHLLRVSSGLLHVLGRPAALGRTLDAGDDGVAVISHGLWQRRFSGDPAIVGRTIVLSGREHLQIVGVMPPDFALPSGGMFGSSDAHEAITADLWTPMPLDGPRWRTAEGALARQVQALAVFGRLAPGISREQAEADVRQIARRLAEAHPTTNRHRDAAVVSLAAQTAGDLRPALLVLMAAVAVLLLMAAGNVANLVLARSVSRHGEFAVRAALGAPRSALVRQVLVEGLLLASAGGLLGLFAAGWAVQVLMMWAPPGLQGAVGHAPAGALALVLVTAVAGTTLAVGLLPALTATGGNLAPSAQHQGRGHSTSRTGRRLRAGLVSAQVALAVLLATGAGLLARSFYALLAVDPGFHAEHVLTFQMTAPDRLADGPARLAFYEALFEQLASLPGVEAVGGVTRIPLGSSNVSTRIELEGAPAPDGPWPEVEFRRVMHQYFQAMGIPILHGHGFQQAGAQVSAAAVINETLARRLFGAADPVGRRVRLRPAASPWLTIVGVVGDIRHEGLDRPPAPELYLDYAQNPPVTPFMVMRTSLPPAEMIPSVRHTVRRLDPAAAPYRMQTMDDVRHASVEGRRFTAFLLTLFGMAALFVAATGVYGVANVVATERTREVGVRMALGARPAAVVRLIVGQSCMLAAMGALTGAAAAALAAPVIASQLFGVGAHDPLTFAAVPLLLVLVAAAASLGPAARAARIDPLVALRQE